MGSQPSRLSDLTPGDLVKMPRNGYDHWGVYVGDGYIVHLVPNSGWSSSNSGMSERAPGAKVRKERLEDVAKEWSKCNSLDDRYNPRQARLIVNEANALVGKAHKYDFIKYNCEHFANELRYGKAESRQVQDGTIGVMATVVGVLGLAAVAVTGRRAV